MRLVERVVAGGASDVVCKWRVCTQVVCRAGQMLYHIAVPTKLVIFAIRLNMRHYETNIITTFYPSFVRRRLRQRG